MRTHTHVEAPQLFSLIFMSQVTKDSSLTDLQEKDGKVQKKNALEFGSLRSISSHLLPWIWKVISDNISLKTNGL